MRIIVSCRSLHIDGTQRAASCIQRRGPAQDRSSGQRLNSSSPASLPVRDSSSSAASPPGARQAKAAAAAASPGRPAGRAAPHLPSHAGFLPVEEAPVASSSTPAGLLRCGRGDPRWEAAAAASQAKKGLDGRRRRGGGGGEASALHAPSNPASTRPPPIAEEAPPTARSLVASPASVPQRRFVLGRFPQVCGGRGCSPVTLSGGWWNPLNTAGLTSECEEDAGGLLRSVGRTANLNLLTGRASAGILGSEAHRPILPSSHQYPRSLTKVKSTGAYFAVILCMGFTCKLCTFKNALCHCSSVQWPECQHLHTNKRAQGCSFDLL